MSKQTEIFRQIWEHSNRRSFVSDLSLIRYANTSMFPSCFAHVLAKGQNKYPKFKFYAKNIVLLIPIEHHLLDSGSEKERQHYANGGEIDWQPLYDLREELIQEYEREFPRNIGTYIGYKYSQEEVDAKVDALNKKYFDGLRE
jgi:hypothetical protein